MKTQIIVLSALLLAACGSGGGNNQSSTKTASDPPPTPTPTPDPPPTQTVFKVGGTAINNGGTGSQLVLYDTLNDDSYVFVPNQNGSWAFNVLYPNGRAYNVTVTSSPTGQTCTVSNGSGTVSGADVNNIDVTCVNNPSPTPTPSPAPTPPPTTTESLYIGAWTSTDASTDPLDTAPLNNTGGTLLVDSYGNYWAAIQISTCASNEAGVLGTNAYFRGPPPNVAANCSSGPVSGPSQLSFTPSMNNGAFSVVEQFTVRDVLLSSDSNSGNEPETNTATWTSVSLTGAPSLTAVAGTWTLNDGNQIVIAADGTFTLDDFTGQELESQCKVTGTVSIGDTSVPIYTIIAAETNGCGNAVAANDTGSGVFIVQNGRLVGGMVFTGTNESVLVPF